MQRTVITYGLIAGLILAILSAVHLFFMHGGQGEMDMTKGMVIGYATMIVSLSMVFFGVRQFRDRHQEGKITFGRALLVGFLIALIASSVYVIGWMIYYHNSEAAQAWMNQYVEQAKAEWVASGMTPEQLQAKVTDQEEFLELYNNNFLVMAGVTLMEIIPAVILMSLLSALILKKK